jgi:hypothetical protein
MISAPAGAGAVLDDDRLIGARRRAGAVDHPHVGERDHRGVDRNVLAHGVRELGPAGGRLCACRVR